jgi:hypothetical protein
MVRVLAQALGLLPDDDPEQTSAPSPGSAGPPPDAGPDRDRDAALAAADERWWAEVEARALRGEWGGEDDPPAEELERWWNLDAAEQATGPDPWLDPVRGPGVDAGTRPDAASDPDGEGSAAPADRRAATALDEAPSWAELADRSVARAGRCLLYLDLRLAAARRAVTMARLADLDEIDDVEQSAAARISAATDAIGALAHASTAQRAALAALLDRPGGGGLVDRPRIAVTDALTGALLALTDARELRAAANAGRGLGPPGPTDGYRPGARLDRFVRARDRRCRFPGCRRRVPDGGELDHDRPYPLGPTSATNLTGFCTGHHRGKHQAPGWRYDLSADGTLTVTTPTGLTATTEPPPF